MLIFPVMFKKKAQSKAEINLFRSLRGNEKTLFVWIASLETLLPLKNESGIVLPVTPGILHRLIV